MRKAHKGSVTIIGAGLAGCYLAILLAKRGYKVDIFEKHSRAELIASSSKRSINLTFFSYGVLSLKEAGIWKTLSPFLTQLRGSVTQVGFDSRPVVCMLDDKKMPYYTVQRSFLLKILMQKARNYSSITTHYNTTLLSVDRKRRTIFIQSNKTRKQISQPCNVVIGTDGVHSLVRGFLQQGQPAQHIQEYLPWRYKQILLQKNDIQNLKLQSDYMYAWTRKDAVLTAFPSGDGSFSAMLTLPNDQTHGFPSLTTEAEINYFITRTFPSFIPALPAVTKALLKNPEGYFVTIDTSPWYYQDFMAILGDAAHGFLPFFGQGMSAAFGDCRVLVQLLDKHNGDFGKVLPLFQEERKKHTDVMAQLSRDSFERFRRHRRGDYTAVYDRVDSLLHAILPQIFHPSLFSKIAVDPDHSAEIVLQHMRQRKLLRYSGVPFMVRVITAGVRVRETVIRSNNRSLSKGKRIFS